MNKIQLYTIPKSDYFLRQRMKIHYSQPRGFKGRTICYAILYNDEYYGNIVAGSAASFLPGRHEFLGTNKDQLNNIVNNIFFNVSIPEGQTKYPIRNFTTKVLKHFMDRVIEEWKMKYGDEVLGFETMVKPPRTGELYKRAGWKVVGRTKGFLLRQKNSKKHFTKSDDPNEKKWVLCYKVS
jgi:hypothetical protein